MKFSNYPYIRPDLNEFESTFNSFLNQFRKATSAEQQTEIRKEINKNRDHFESMMSLAAIRHSIDSADSFYLAEKDFFDEKKPFYDALITRYYKAILSSDYIDGLKETFGHQLFRLAEKACKIFSPAIIKDLQTENRLVSDYSRMLASAVVKFRGKEYNLSSLHPFEISADRETREEAYEARFGFYAKHADTLDQIFDELVKVRHHIALKLGYKNFIGLAYDRLQRTDFNPEMSVKYRNQIAKYIVPITGRLLKSKQKELGLDHLEYFDQAIYFKDGNAKLLGNTKEVLQNTAKMYEELSSESNEFFNFMLEKGLMDLESKKNKSGGGYCEYLPAFKSPFIFSNFTGTSSDMDVLTHEAGHAFQIYQCIGMVTPEYYFPTYEACEIHSMSMEYFTYPWMHLFFGREINKYLYAHMASSINFLPYGVAIDEFQHEIYSHPEMKPSERNSCWRKIEKKYLPFKHYTGNKYLENGGFWQKQAHIFNSPFYYLDYTLAGVCALQFWIKDKINHQSAWQNYLNLCKKGGSLSFLELVKVAKLQSPFEENTMKSVAEAINAWLDEFLAGR